MTMEMKYMIDEKTDVYLVQKSLTPKLVALPKILIKV